MGITGKIDSQTSLKEICLHYNIDENSIPRHVAIIMDGNGRWAKKRHRPRTWGHKAGTEALRRAIKACVEFNIHYLSVYAFSTENWKRPKEEVSFLMKFFEKLIIKELAELKKEGVRVRFCGNRSVLSNDLQDKMKQAEDITEKEHVLQLNLMVNYGSRDEIVRACKIIAADIQKEKMTIEEVTEELFSNYLYTEAIPDPEILIRTGGDNIRISNYLLWQIAYTELFFIDDLWPDFNRDILARIIGLFQKRERKLGGLGK